ncbi:hypothetical protein ACHAWT_010952 [Skeletonema menzelii]
MYAQNAYFKQRQENLLPTRSPSNSDNDQRQRRRREGPEAAEARMFRSSDAYHSLNSDLSAAMGNNSSNDRVVGPFTARHEHQPYQTDERLENASKRRRVRQLLLLASVAFVGLLVIDGMAQFHYLPDVSVETVYETAEHYERKLVQHRQQQQNDSEGGLVRRLVGAFLGEEQLTKQRPHIVVEDGNQAEILEDNNNSVQRQRKKQRALLHTLPLLPRHALQHRQRRELIDSRKPIPRHLRENAEDEMYHAPHHQRKRIYPVMTPDGKVVDARNRHLADEGSTYYETGALYQGYGTHYLDLWVGTPPQRQTVIVDTGSSITAFPCSGCDHCGDNSATGELYHLDEDFDKFKSSTYEQFECSAGQQGSHNVKCQLGVCRHSDPQVADSDQVCQLAVSYAEGSSWTAVEGSDVCYPGGPHETPLTTNEQRMAEGVGVGMGEVGAGKEFDWLDFRLKFGCQTKVTGLFRTQLEDGIMGMDNRVGSFWMQLREHYKSQGSSLEEPQEFDPSQFSLCYDRKPVSSELSMGVGSGALTLGGSDSLLHSTPMVYADNVTPGSGWYTVHVKAMFLRSKGGSLSEPANNSRYVRVDADETTLNGNTGSNHGIIVDSGTTDSYLPSNLKPAFLDAWREVLRDPSAEYHNSRVEMTAEQVKTLPTILVVLQGYKADNSQTNDFAVGMAGHDSHAAMFNSITDKSPLTISKNDVVVAIPPEHYMEESHSSPGTFIARVYFTEKFGQQSIFGSIFMMGQEILFDNSSGRVGFAESHCDYSRYMEERDLMLEQARQNAVVEEGTEEVVNSAQQEGQDNLHGSGWS